MGSFALAVAAAVVGQGIVIGGINLGAWATGSPWRWGWHRRDPKDPV